MLCAIFALECIAPLIINISAAKVVQSVDQRIRKQRKKAHNCKCPGSNLAGLFCFATQLFLTIVLLSNKP